MYRGTLGVCMTALSVLILTVFAAPLPSLAQERQERTVETLMDAYNVLVKQGMEATETLLKSKKREKSEVEAVWDDLNERFISVYSKVGHFEFDSMLKKERNEARASRASEWDNSMKLFIHDLQKVGEVVAWQRKVNRDIAQLEYDIEKAPKRVEAYSGKLKEEGPRVEKLLHELKSGSLSSAELQQRLDEVKNLRAEAENVSNSLERTLTRLGEDLLLKPEMDKRIAQILENWSNMKARHPAVADDLTDMPANWIPLVKKHWKDLEETREKFEEEYAPILDGKLFSDVPFFQNRPYKDLAKPVIELEIQIKTAIVSAVQKEKSVEDLRKAIALDEELTRKEIQRIQELNSMISPEKWRALLLEDARAAGGASRVRELQLVMARHPEESEEYRKASEEAHLIQDEQHPEQLAVKKKLREFEELERKVFEEIRKLHEEHEKRRKSLGLAPGLSK